MLELSLGFSMHGRCSIIQSYLSFRCVCATQRPLEGCAGKHWSHYTPNWMPTQAAPGSWCDLLPVQRACCARIINSTPVVLAFQLCCSPAGCDGSECWQCFCWTHVRQPCEGFCCGKAFVDGVQVPPSRLVQQR